jgi:hypothetical protein
VGAQGTPDAAGAAHTSLSSPQDAAGSRSAASATGDRPRASEELEHGLHAVAEDRGATAEAIVLEAGRLIHAWILARPADSTWAAAGLELERGWASWVAEQGWRGPAALFVDTLRQAWWLGRALERGSPTPRELLAEATGLWLWDRDEDTAELTGADALWDGSPLAPGRRMPERTHAAHAAAEDLARGEVVLVPAWSHTVTLALAHAQRLGRAPRAIVPEGAPGLDGRRLARELCEAGVAVRLVYDAALPTLLPHADRVWLGSEAIGGADFLARVGTRHLLEEAERRDVPAQLDATSDTLVPGGMLVLPAWGERDDWLLGESAPDGVRLDPQPYETVSHDLVTSLCTQPSSAASSVITCHHTPS